MILLQDITEENQPSSPPPSPHFSVTKKIEELENGTDVSERPSPVSVLDTSFSDDDFCPGHSRCEPGKHSCTRTLRGISGYVLKSENHFLETRPRNFYVAVVYFL